MKSTTISSNNPDWNKILRLVEAFGRKDVDSLKKVTVASALIFDELQENVLLVLNNNNNSPYWSLPGGYVEPGETLTEAVIREVKEETGLTISVTNLYWIREVIFTIREHHAYMFTFLANITDGEIFISDPDHEVVEVKWVDLNTANERMSYLPEKIREPAPHDRFASYHYQISNHF